MGDPFKNFECSACMWYANHYCFEKLMKVHPHELCPEFKFIMEDI